MTIWIWIIRTREIYCQLVTSFTGKGVQEPRQIGTYKKFSSTQRLQRVHVYGGFLKRCSVGFSRARGNAGGKGGNDERELFCGFHEHVRRVPVYTYNDVRTLIFCVFISSHFSLSNLSEAACFSRLFFSSILCFSSKAIRAAACLFSISLTVFSNRSLMDLFSFFS